MLMRFHGGWVKHWRNLDNGDHWISSNSTAYCIFLRLIAWANIEKTRVPKDSGFIEVERGSVVTSASEIGVSFGFDQKTVKKYLKMFENDGMIRQLITTRGRIITICNYEKFQENKKNNDRVMDDSVDESVDDSVRTVRTTSSPLIEELKKIKEGKEEKEELNIAEGATPTTALVKKEPRSKKPKEPSKGGPTWEAYSNAYAKKYGHPPARSARENSICAQIVDRVGAEDAPLIAEFYLSHTDRWYVQKAHSLPLLLADIQKLRTEWLAGTKITQGFAKEVDLAQHNRQTLEKFKQMQGIK